MSHLLKASGLRQDLQNSTERLRKSGFSTCPACGGYTLFDDTDHCINPDCQWMIGDPIPAPDKELFNRAVTREVPVDQTSRIATAADFVVRTIERVLGIGRGAK